MNIVHFDLGSHMAFAHNAGGGVEVGHFDADGPRQQRAAQILAWLNDCFVLWEMMGITFDVCHYERPFARGFDATRCGWGIAGIIEAAFGSRCVVLDTTPQSIKSFALGSKKVARARKKMTSAERHKAAAAEKLAMIARAKELGYTGDNEHEADAFLGLKYAETYCRKEQPSCPPATKKSLRSTKSTVPSTPLPASSASPAARSKKRTRKPSRKA